MSAASGGVLADTGIAGATLHEVFANRVARHPDDLFLHDPAADVHLTWAQAAEQMRRIAGGLVELGVRRFDRVGLLVPNSAAFYLGDLAIVALGAVPISIYGTSSPEQIRYVVQDAGIDVLLCDQATLPRVLAAREDVNSSADTVASPRPEAPGTIVVVDGPDDGEHPSLADVARRCPDPFDLAAITAEATPDDLLTTIYTSGTTGPPKGVELTHRNLLSGMRALTSVLGVGEHGRVISWLPTAHIAERGAHYYCVLLWGLEVTTCADPRTIAQVLPTVRPTWFFAVPRVWEKLKAGVEAAIGAQPAAVREAMTAAVDRGVRRVEAEQAGEPVPSDLQAAAASDDERFFAPLRERLGLDAADSVSVGSAPVPRDVVVFFHAIGLPLGEIWGMSEACACGTLNPPGAVRIGSVGKPLPGIELRLEPDGEILLRGEPLMRGYHALPEKTAEALTDDGFFRTGDVGRFDADGYLWIVDRKKELIINSSGKNMSPSSIESAVKSESALIGQAVAVGSGRSYVAALLILDPDAAADWARRYDVSADLPELARNPELLAEVQRAVDAGNARLSRVEHVRRFVVLGDEWVPGSDELTPTSKLRRRPIEQRYAAEIEAMYE